MLSAIIMLHVGVSLKLFPFYADTMLMIHVLFGQVVFERVCIFNRLIATYILFMVK